MNKITSWLGRLFCEASFRGFRLWDVPVDEKEWKWRHKVWFFINSKLYFAGCFFYDMEEGENGK